MIKKYVGISAVFIISTFAGAGYIFLHRGRVNLSSAGAEAEKEAEKRTVLHRHCL